MNLREAIDDLLRKQTDSQNVIETLWLMFAAHVKTPRNTVQWVESRRCFFAGAATLFETVMRIMDADAEPTEADLARMDRIAKELERYSADLAAGRG